MPGVSIMARVLPLFSGHRVVDVPRMHAVIDCPLRRLPGVWHGMLGMVIMSRRLAWFGLIEQHRCFGSMPGSLRSFRLRMQRRFSKFFGPGFFVTLGFAMCVIVVR